MDRRFELISPLGSGGQGHVFLVRDKNRGGLQMALKRLTGEEARKSSLALEFDRLSKLRHPNLARAFDFGEDDEGVYFTSEYIDGVGFLEFAKTADTTVFVEALGALLRALALLHDRDLVHGDLNPENVLVTKDNTLKLLDLGGACRPGQQGSGMTAGFAAPEVLTGRGALPVSDLYAFGALASRVLLGVSPFGEESASVIVQRQLEGALQLPDETLSPVAALCRKLLATDPAKRPRNAEETLRQLADATEVNLRIDLTDCSPLDLPEPKMVQRSQASSTLYSMIEQVDSTSMVPVGAIIGDVGSGRTTLLMECARFAQINGFGIIGEADVPRNTIHLLSALSRACDANALSPEAKKSLAPWMDTKSHPTFAPSSAWTASVVFAALEALDAACRTKPQLLIVDNFFQKDRLVQEVVAALARALAPEQGRPRAVMLLAFEKDKQDSWQAPIGPSVHLSPLDSRGIHELVTSMLPGIAEPEGLSDAIFLASDGNPSRAVEAIRSAAGVGWEQLAATVKQKVTELDKSQRALVAVIGTVAHPLPRAVCENVAAGSLDALLKAGFCYEVGDPGDPHLQAASSLEGVARDLSDEDEFIAIAGKMAEVLEERGSLTLAATLYITASKPDRATTIYRTLADRCQSVGDFSGAAEWFEKAVSAYDGNFDIFELARDAVQTWHAIGWHEQALLALPLTKLSEGAEGLLRAELNRDMGRHQQALAILATIKDEAHAMERQSNMAACENQLGRHESALALVQETVSAHPERPLPVALAELSQTGGLACTYLAQQEKAKHYFELAKEGFAAADDQLGLLRVSANMGMLERLRGNLAEASKAYENAVALAKAIGDRPREGLHLMNRATVSQVACNYAAAYDDYRKALEIATVLGNDFRMTQVEVNFADLLLDLGQTAAANKMILNALQRSRSLCQRRLEMRALLTAGRAAMLAGDFVRAESRLQDARRRFAAAGDEVGLVSANQQLSELYLERGDQHRACDLATDLAKATSRHERRRGMARAHLLLARCAMQSGGDPRTALIHLETSEEILRKKPAPDVLWRIALLRHRALKKQNRKEAAEKALLQAQSVFDTLLERVPEQYKKSFIAAADAEELTPTEETTTEPSERWSRDLEMLMEINRALTRERDPKRLLNLIMESAVELTGAERGMLVMPKEGELVQVIAYQLSDETDKRFSRSVAEKVVAEDRAVLAVDALDDARFRTFMSVNAMKLRSILAVPLRIKRRVVGVVYLDSRLRTGVFTDADRRLLEAFGAQAAICLETARLISENERHLDELKEANAEIQKLSDKLKERLENREAKLKRVGALLEKTQSEESDRIKKWGMVGRSAAMQQVKKMIDRIALADVPIYIFGGSGTGKELAAKAVHSASERASKPFIPINCGALPPKLLASELFGHKKGAFTGAVGNRPGLFKLADNGTLFLDEVADMDREMQTHLLRVLQDGTFRALGDTEEIAVDVRIISASNKDLEKEVTLGNFREDLFYRLNVVRIDLPSLNERREDIPLLVEFMLKRHQKKGELPKFTKEAINLLMGAEWPGNVRELENEVLRSMTMAGDKRMIEPEDLSPRFNQSSTMDAWSSQGSLKDRVTHFEGVIINQALSSCSGNATKAAKLLGVSRATLYKKMEKCGISPDTV